MTDGKEPINPIYWDERHEPAFKTDGSGLTKKEYFAAMAMQGLLSNASESVPLKEDTIAKWSVEQSDALIAELNK